MSAGAATPTDRARSVLVLALLFGLATLFAGIMGHAASAIVIGSVLLVMTAAFAVLLHEVGRI